MPSGTELNCPCLRAIQGDGAPAPEGGKSSLYPVLSVIPFLFLSRIGAADGNPHALPCEWYYSMMGGTAQLFFVTAAQ